MKTRRTSLRCNELETRLTPADLSLVAAVGRGAYAVGPDAGDPGTVTVFRADGSVGLSGEPYGPGFAAGVRVALTDVDGDGAPDVVTAPGPGAAPDVHVYSGRTGRLIGSFGAFEGSFRGGVYVGAADL